MANRIKSALGRLFENGTRPEPVHFHNSGGGHAFVCHDERCTSPRLDVRDMHPVRPGDRGAPR